MAPKIIPLHELKSYSIKNKTDQYLLTNANKLYFPADKITKGDIFHYYESIAQVLLPHLCNRPQALRRHPDGIAKSGFFQKNMVQVPSWLTTISLITKNQKTISWLLCQNIDTLLYMVNLGCIELHPWISHVPTVDFPDFIVFDLDPEQAESVALIRTALAFKHTIDHLQLISFIKTSGGRGLHIYIPIKNMYSFKQTRSFSKCISQMVHEQLPAITTLSKSSSGRQGKIYLDYQQNARGKTMVSAYAIRARAGAPISTPLCWDEIDEKLPLPYITIKTILPRIKEKGDLWAPLIDKKNRQKLDKKWLR